MSMPRRQFLSFTPVSSLRLAPIAGALAALLISSNAYAAVFGHSRIVSSPGQPLAIDVPVSRLSDQDLASLKLAPAPATAWSQAGLTPPVDLDSLQLHLADGIAPGKRVIQIRSSQPSDVSIIDVLLDIGTASGQQRYQVSLLARGVAPASQASSVAAGTGAGASAGGSREAPQATLDSIAVKRGDILFSIARKHAVPDVSVYQMLVGLYQANPQAFIQRNLNLLRADATLIVPDATTLSVISDAQARRIFQQHAQAFAAYKRGNASTASIDSTLAVDVAATSVQGGTVERNADGVSAPASTGDQLRLSGANGVVGSGSANANVKTVAADGSSVINSAANSDLADDRLATAKGIDDTGQRVSQLEENVKNLNLALQSQGEAAKDLVLEGAKGISESLSQMADAVTEATATSTTTANTTSAPGTSQGAATADASAGVTTGIPANAAGNASAGVSANAAAGTPAGGTSAAGVTADANRVNNVTDPISQKADTTVSWFQENLLAVTTGVLALIVLFIAWLLRRANVSRNQAGAISPAMVKQKLDEINLDLNQPASDSLPSSKS